MRSASGWWTLAPIVEAAPIVFECRYVRTVEIPKVKHGAPEADNFLI
jgi:flavin reductase (DIM6/NTAB) family NADH-FMN oxidoreductase RutF